jgi:hypothetical protein
MEYAYQDGTPRDYIFGRGMGAPYSDYGWIWEGIVAAFEPSEITKEIVRDNLDFHAGVLYDYYVEELEDKFSPKDGGWVYLDHNGEERDGKVFNFEEFLDESDYEIAFNDLVNRWREALKDGDDDGGIVIHNARLIEHLTRMGACAEAIQWIGTMSAAEALAALEPTEQHIEWSCWVADRVLPDDAQRRLRAALLRTMPKHLVAIPVVAGVIKALEADPFDPERFEAARTEAAVARAQATSNATWPAARVARAAAWAAMWMADEAVAKAAMAAGVDEKDVLRRRLAVVKEALTDFLKTSRK